MPDPLPRKTLLSWVVLSEAAALFLALLGFTFGGVRPGMDLTLSSLLVGAVVGAAGAQVALALVRLPGRFFGTLRQNLVVVMRLFANARRPDLVLMAVLAGICEELLFRGFLQEWAATAVGEPAAILLVALFFGLVHALSLPYVVLAFALGAGMGVLYAWTGSLPAVMLTHALYDLVVLWRLKARPVSRREGGLT